MYIIMGDGVCDFLLSFHANEGSVYLLEKERYINQQANPDDSNCHRTLLFNGLELFLIRKHISMYNVSSYYYY
jgi:hypothetical protein